MAPFHITRLIWPALLALAALVACDDDAVGSGEDNPSDALPTGDLGGGGAGGASDQGPDLDTGPVDMQPDASQFGEGGDPCERGSDCRSGYCVPGPDGARVCSELCRNDEDCDEGFECSSVINTAPDTVFICIALRNNQCLPCDHDGDCGSGVDRCVEIGAATYCARSCATAECPEGNTCEEREIDGETVPLCIPEVGSCRPCMDADDDGYGQGEECLGIDCDDSDPDIFEGAAELCDGRDNDCDSETDEGELVAPDEGLCLSQGVCEGTAPTCEAGGWSCPYPDTYEPGAETRCDGLDNDCDGAADDDIDFQGDAANCGECGLACAYENAAGVCVEAMCSLGDCARGWFDIDQDPANGCEYPCVPTEDPTEICDSRDNDCDGTVDEGFDLDADPSHCGQCNRVCAIDRAAPACDGGQCVIEACEDGWWNNDRDPANGCEYNCLLTFEGEERCDTLDNDCDGTPDEDFDFVNDPTHCGGCGVICEFPQGQAGCAEAQCVLVGCAPGFVDLDGDAANGCELECTPTADPTEVCDTIDNDCDGNTDEGFDLANDEANCGACGQICDPPDAIGQCRVGECFIAECAENTWDLNEAAEDGCEYACEGDPEAEEVCDGEDQDCDGAIDEGFDLQLDPNNCGACNQTCEYDNGVPACDEGLCVLSECEQSFHDLDGDPENGCEYGPCLPTQDGVEVCDLIDNDCDGTADEGFDLARDLDHCGSCGRICAAGNATPVCVDGRCLVAECDEGFVDLDGEVGTGCEYECTPTGDEICDETDNDCDGQIDEGFDLEASLEHCGGCGRTCAFDNAVAACEEGACRFVECAPNFYDVEGGIEDGCEYACVITNDGAEQCDNVDNDCDGVVDEDLQRGCGSDVGQCRPGQQTCAAGDWGVCDGEIPPEEEICDGRDNDCDGETDEGLFRQCGSDVGACEFGIETCREGDWGTCEGDTEPEEELCDNTDNDCDGQIDEAVTRSCGQNQGECQSGTETCQAGAWGACEGAEDPGVETCDNRDNDCDGIVDEGLQRGCGSDVGACEAGTQTCEAGNWGVCDGEVVAQPEACDAVDNDCDGSTDEALVRDCGSDVGLCRLGSQMCAVGVWGACMNDVGPADEACDNQDNDCDGSVDEDVTRACGDDTGACQQGTETCQAGGWGACEGEIVPEQETCDAVDNDCDGTVDEGLSRRCGSDVGACQRGTQTCGAGDWGVCADEITPVAEQCNGIDDDCDGEIDEGFADLEDRPDDNFEDTNCDGIDGDIEDAIFLASNGDDNNPGTQDRPKASFNNAMATAVAQGKYVIASDGTYEGQVVVVDGATVYGGYQRASNWARSDDFQTIVLGGTLAMDVRNLSRATLIDRVTVRAATNPVPSLSSIALRVQNSANHFTLSNSDLIAGDGAPGSAGDDGDPGTAGRSGGQGSNGCNDDFFGVGGCGRDSGDGAAARVCADGRSTGRGGNGGVGGRDSSGQAGADGRAGAAAADGGANGGADGDGSAGGRQGYDRLSGFNCVSRTAGRGVTGLSGRSGSAGNDGAGGGDIGQFLLGIYLAANGSNGRAGGHGGGGGGGGGGGAFDHGFPCSTDIDDIGGSGGGGGSGGCGGLAGLGGEGGGASIGALISSSNPILRRVSITTGAGGDGGVGGRGGNGGGGGARGGAGNGHQDAASGGSGGLGGTGGRGGHGGGGGGGPSVGVVRVGGANPTLDRVQYSLGQAGEGGAPGGAGGDLGEDGVRANVITR